MHKIWNLVLCPFFFHTELLQKQNVKHSIYFHTFKILCCKKHVQSDPEIFNRGCKHLWRKKNGATLVPTHSEVPCLGKNKGGAHLNSPLSTIWLLEMDFQFCERFNSLNFSKEQMPKLNPCKCKDCTYESNSKNFGFSHLHPRFANEFLWFAKSKLPGSRIHKIRWSPKLNQIMIFLMCQRLRNSKKLKLKTGRRVPIQSRTNIYVCKIQCLWYPNK